jgi:hypothetical protein
VTLRRELQPSAGYYQGDDLLTADDVAGWLKVKRSWIKEKTRRRNQSRSKNPFPYSRADRFIRFSRMRIAEWLAKNSI